LLARVPFQGSEQPVQETGIVITQTDKRRLLSALLKPSAMSAIVKDIVMLAEEGFYEPRLIATEYFKKYREGYYLSRQVGLLNPNRNYIRLINLFAEIDGYNKEHAAHYSKRIRETPTDWNNCEAVVSEMIVYWSYIRLINEELIKSISIERDECDLIVERRDGSKYYLEVFCITPPIEERATKNPVAQNINTHTQTAFSSVRQKLLNKARKQGQFSKQRENYAVIELNHPLIANDFTVLSSLSEGYKVHFDLKTGKSTHEGYDWGKSVFDSPEMKFLKGVIWFSLGGYEYRKILLNGSFGKSMSCE
jgi:hypothetical protein